MEDKATLGERVSALRLNPDAIERIDFPSSKETIENTPGTQKSLQIYAHITTNDSYIGPAEAKAGLAIYGEELMHETRYDPTKHPSVTRLEKIVDGNHKIRVNVIRKNSAMPMPSYLLKKLPEIIKQVPTPFYIYDERAIKANARKLNTAFNWTNFKEFFAVKACPNPSILNILKQEGCGADCSSLPELLLAEKVGITGENIMFTSNGTHYREYQEAMRLGAIINFDDISHIEYALKHSGLPKIACFRYNPGKLRKGNSIIGQPEEAKYGLTKEQLFEAYRIMKSKGVKRGGLHTMIASNERSSQYFIDTSSMVFDLVAEISKKEGINFEFVNLGGGIGIPYKPEQLPVDLDEVSEGIKQQCAERILKNGLNDPKIFMENGRMMTGPFGYLITNVLHVEKKHKDYVRVDASMANLMRPGMYGAFHPIYVLGKENQPLDHIYDVADSLCENCGKFAVNRPLPKIASNDKIAIGCSGAHSYAMGFNYNGKLKCSEINFKEDDSFEMTRRAETIDDYFSTLKFPGSKFF